MKNDIVLLCAADFGNEENEGGKPKFRIEAYTGGKINVCCSREPVVIEMSGINLSKQTIPVFYGHDYTQGIGHTTDISVEGGKLVANGIVSRATDVAEECVKSAKNGFPWQASVGGVIAKSECVNEGEKRNVNGSDIEGPALIVTRFDLKEISFVELGADDNTSASISARKGVDEMAMTDEKEVKLDASAVDSAVQAFNTSDTNSSENLEAKLADQIEKKVQERFDKIRSIEERDDGSNPELKAKALKEGWSADKFELELLRASRNAVPFYPCKQVEYTDAVLRAGAMMSAGMAVAEKDEVLASAENLKGIGFRELCEIKAAQKGVHLPSYRNGEGSWLKAAFSTVGVSGLVSDLANKVLLDCFNYADDSWRSICSISSVRDFKKVTRYRMTTGFGFLPVAPDGEIKHGTIGEQSFEQQADTYGIRFEISRQMIKNDDLGAMLQLPQQIGIGAARTLAKAVWSCFMSNPTCADGNNFFSAAHNNLLTGADYALGVDGLSAGEAKFADQTDPNGDPLGIVPNALVVPTGLRAIAEALYKSTFVNETTTANKARPAANIHANKYAPVVSPFLGRSTITGYSTTAWYLVADPKLISTIDVAFLNGIDRPTVESAELDLDHLGIGLRGYFDFGVALQDWRGAVKVTGTN